MFLKRINAVFFQNMDPMYFYPGGKQRLFPEKSQIRI